MSQSYKIAIIAGQLVVGGAERQLFLWLSNLDRARFQPVVVTLHPGYGDHWEKRIEALGIPVLHIPRGSCRLVRLLDIVRALRPYRPQLIHGWHTFSSPYAGAAAKLLGARSLGGVRGSFSTFLSAPLVARLTLYLVDGIVANSNTTAIQLRAARKREKQVIFSVQNALDAQVADRATMRQELSQKFGFSPAGIWIGSLGRLDPKKQFDMILRVLALLRKDRKDFHFLLIGDGPEKASLENMAEVLGIAEYITFAGEVPGASAWLGALDIFCFTSLDEGLPNAVMEAAAAGVPVVAWRLPFVEELLNDGKMALLVEPEDINQFKDALLKLFLSPDLRIIMGQAGRDHILKEFNLDRYVQRMTSVYEHLLGIQPAFPVGVS
jgi:glycosyltransferase involved in cell wall biosynthesis